MRILFVVAARGGSKGVPHKNIAIIGKYPLIAYKLIAARKCHYDNRIIVSTDDKDIADVAKKYGGEVPFMRPDYLATDNANSIDVVTHAMDWVKTNDDSDYDYVCLLEPSSPFLSYIDIDEAFKLLENTNADTLLGIKKVEVGSRFIFPLDEKGGLSLFYESISGMQSVRRQDQPLEYTLNGCIYVAKWDYFERERLFHSINSIPYIMTAEQSVEIDSIMDLQFATMIAEKGLINLKLWD